MNIKRILNLTSLINKNSYFLFGPRGTGKSYLIRNTLLSKVNYIDLLHSKTFLRLKVNPSELEAFISHDRVVIDEIQRIPELLNEIHRLIETKQIKFLLTGSSARKLRRGGINLLAGRAFKSELFPLTWYELNQIGKFDLMKYLSIGGLPKAYLEEEPKEYLYTYVETYLKEEIQAESIVRNLANYARFLENAAFSNTNLINYTTVANDAQLAPNTVRDYYKILEDTLIGFQLPSWKASKKRKAIQVAKFYFFDIGVVNTIRGIEYLEPHSDIFGKAFEQFIGQEIRSYLSYKRIRKPLCFWRSTSGFEVDFIIGDEIGIETKASKHATERDHSGLKALSEEKKWNKLIIVSLDSMEMHYPSGIIHLHWQKFLENLWNGKII